VSPSRRPVAPQAWSALACALAGLALFQFFGNAGRGYIDSASLFYWWGYQWLNPASETEHGWVILALSGWLMWRQRAALARDPSPAGSIWPAALALLAALLLHAAGFAAQQARISIVALLVYAWGVIRLAGGPRWGAAALFPLGFLVFAIPVGILDEIGLPLRVWVTDAGEAIARAAGIPVLRSGTQLLAPDGRFNYDVAAPCSGVRSLMALTALTLLFGYLNFRSAWRRGLILALALPLVYLGNVVRIVAIIFAAHAAGSAWGERVHAIMGYGVFVIVLGGVLAAIAVLQRFRPEAAAGDAPDSPAPATGSARAGMRPAGSTGAAVAAVVVALAGAEMAFLHRLAQRPGGGEAGVRLAADGLNPVELPAFLGTEWIGQRVEVSPVEREILPPDTGYSRRWYANLADRRRDVFLSIVLSGRDRTSIHRPELCLVGQGWTIEGATRHAFRGAGGGPVPATVLRVRRERPTPQGRVSVPQLVAYWFAGRDTVTPSHWGRFWTDTWNRVARARVDRWAYVLLQTDLADGEAGALARMQAVLDGTLPVFQPGAGESESPGRAP